MYGYEPPPHVLRYDSLRATYPEQPRVDRILALLCGVTRGYLRMGAFTREELCRLVQEREDALSHVLSAEDIRAEIYIPVQARDLLNPAVHPSASRLCSNHVSYLDRCNRAALAEGIRLTWHQKGICIYRRHQREWTRHLISISSPFMLKVLRGCFARVFHKIPSRW